MEQKPVKIYSVEDVPRLRYIAGILLGEILGLEWEVITDKRKVGKNPVINYSTENISGAIKISPDSLLFEKGIRTREIEVSQWNGLPSFFLTSSDSDIPFDIFAASFYLITRYEEYLEFHPDEHGRYPASASLSYRNGFLQIPVIDMWTKEFSKVFLKKNQTLAFKKNRFKAIVTLDTDQPFAYRGKGLIRSIGGLFNDIKGNTGHAADRYRSVTKGEHDPFEVFDYIAETIDSSRSEARFFFPVGDYSKYDKNPSWKNDEYKKLICMLAGKYKSGLHPSYISANNSKVISIEVERLSSILEMDVVCSRFHYLRLSMPASYRNLCSAGISEDYSMGYPDEPGFRAGIARPFNFYDVEADKPTNLKIIPFQVMDATLYQYKNLTPESSIELILKIIEETKRAGGLFVSIWHNTSLLDNNEWIPWRKVFEKMLNAQMS